ncbi:MAG: hypothetical protein HOC71_11600 [Candidatus Latescibacteria bacterium]|jgi:long-chain fatty acid transport protein|nr:hypothetical protein [Candidatus Latescibacterota bacterium]
MKKVIAILIVLVLCSTGIVWASGLAIPEQGAAAMAMSAAMTARSEDLSSIFYNPAGIDYVENADVLLGITPIMPSHSFKGTAGSTDAESNVFLPPQIYAAKRINDYIVLGLGVFAPFGLGTDWDEEWNGRYTSSFAEIQSVYINPTISYRLNDKVSLGLGVSYITSSATIERMGDTGLAVYSMAGGSTALAANIGNPAFDSEFSLDGSGSGFGFNIGALIRPIDKLQLGISYRGATDIEYEGKAKFTHKDALKSIPLGGGTVYDAVSGMYPASQDGTATLHLPWMLNLGALYDITDAWDASVDLDFVGWKVYDELVIKFDKGVGSGLATKEQSSPKDWENSFIFRAGTSYDINEALTLRGGFLYDKNPVPDETMDGQLPDADRTGISLGAGYKIGVLRFDISYMLLMFADRAKDNLVGYSDTDIPKNGVGATDQEKLNDIFKLQGRGAYPAGNGDYESSANLLSVSVSYSF